jgi:hypothetical protein
MSSKEKVSGTPRKRGVEKSRTVSEMIAVALTSADKIVQDLHRVSARRSRSSAGGADSGVHVQTARLNDCSK